MVERGDAGLVLVDQRAVEPHDQMTRIDHATTPIPPASAIRFGGGW